MLSGLVFFLIPLGLHFIYIGMVNCSIVAVVNAGGMGKIISGINALTESTTYGGPWLAITGGLGVLTCISYMVSEPGNRITTQSNTVAVAAARSEKTATWGIVLGALCLIPITIISVIIGLIAKVQFPDINSAQAMATVILAQNPLVAALGMVGLWAVTVSTGIVLLMASVQVFCYDVMAPINMRRAKQGVDAQRQMNIQSKIVTVMLSVVMLVCALKATSIVGTIITVLCVTPAFFWIMLSFLYFPKLIKKHSALITQIVAYVFFFAWLFIPAVQEAFPTPIYVEWPLCTVVWFLCALEKTPIDKVVPKDQRVNLGAGIQRDD